VRISRLGIGRYGHLSDVDLVFPASPGMHIVLGANEAGKSTALSAIGDALFRFPTRSNHAFLHATRDLRLAMDLRAADGRAASFVRRKGNKDDLTDETGQILPESAIAAFLAGATRERFHRVFGLDAAELRRGGEAILEGKGEVGESILQAHTGLHGFRALVAKLGEDATRMAGDRRGTRELHVAVKRFEAARRARDERAVEPADYKAASDERDRLEVAGTANAAEFERLSAERARLDRIRRTAPARHAAARAREAAAALGPLPPLPADAESQRQAAITARERAAHDLAGLGLRDADLARRLAGLEIDERLLAEAEAIDALAADRSHIGKTEQDRAEQRIVADQRQRALAQAAQRLGQSDDAATIAARIPDALRRDAANRAILAHARLSERHAKAAEDVATARAQHDAARAALEALPEAPSAAELRAVIDQVKSEGRLDAEFAAAQAAEAGAQAELTRLLAALPLWTGSADALAAAPVPLEAMIADHAARLEQAEATRRGLAEKSAAHDSALAALAADLLRLTEAGTLPTPQAIAAARALRDRAWKLLRRHRIAGGAAPSDAELTDLGPPDALPDRFEALLREADALVDRSAVEAKRIAAFAELRRQQNREAEARAETRAAAAQAEAAHEAAAAAWRALWHPAGIAAEAPAAMREWLRRREAVLAQRQRLGETAAHRAALAARHQVAQAALAAHLPDAPQTGALTALLASAQRLCTAREAAAEARRKAALDAVAATSAAEKQAHALEKTKADLAAWAATWAEAARALGLPPDAAPEAGKLALDLWNQVEAECRAWQAAADRIDQMTRHIDAFAAAAARLTRQLAPDLVETDPHTAIRGLAARLAETRAAAAARATLTAEREALAVETARIAARQAQAESALAALHALAGTEDDLALQDIIARVARRAALDAEIAARAAELHGLNDGKSDAELAAEAEGVEVDTLPGRIAEIETRLRAIADENAAAAGRLAELRGRLAAMETGRDAAGAAQDMEDAAADIDEIAARYVRTRLAHTLLRAGIDSFRRQQQGPLLARAGTLFARLTEGRYERLGVDEDDAGRLSIVALRPDRSDCPAERLSEGTRDQLYLALRLAAIESYAARTEPLPFIADDLLVNFDDRRARAALRVLGEMGASMQVILFTHHAHIAAMADPALASLHHLERIDVPAAAE
jgi:uncharacterized protein YhaN